MDDEIVFYTDANSVILKGTIWYYRFSLLYRGNAQPSERTEVSADKSATASDAQG